MRITRRVPLRANEEEEALSWAGDEERGQRFPRFSSSMAEDVHVGGEAMVVQQLRSRSFGLTLPFGVVYVLLTVGWILSVQLLRYPGVDLVGQIAWQFGEFLAILASPLWFVLASRYVAAKFSWLLVGVLLLLPWPVLLGFFG